MKFNETYTINNGEEFIVFKEGKGNTITGEYNDGILTGTIEGDVLKATFQNKNDNGVGLIEFTFHENGFNAKWKQGLEPGPMKGKWIGLLLDASNKPISAAEMSHLTEEQKEWFDEDYPGSMVAKIVDNISDEVFLDEIDLFFRESLCVNHKFFGAAQVFQYTVLDATPDFWLNNEHLKYIYEKENFQGCLSFNKNFIFNHDLVNSPLVDQILEHEGLDVNTISIVDFKILFSAYFVFIIEGIAADQNVEMLEEFLAIHLEERIHSKNKTKDGQYFGEIWLNQFVKDLMRYLYRKDLTDYTSNYTIFGYYFGFEEIKTELCIDVMAEEIIGEITGVHLRWK